MNRAREVIVFYSRTQRYKRSDFPRDVNIIVLSANQYTAFFKNVSFQAVAYIDDREFILGEVRFLLLDRDGSALYLNKIARSSNERFLRFPLKGLAYISIGLGTEYYERLVELFDRDVALHVLKAVNDWIIIKREGLKLRQISSFEKSKAFGMSFMRGLSSRRASKLAEHILYRPSSSSSDERPAPPPESNLKFGLNFRLSTFERRHELNFDFRKTDLPSNINVLIGSNGTGKTQALKHLVDGLLERGSASPRYSATEFKPSIEPMPAFSQVVVVSFNPFDSFPKSGEVTKGDIEYLYCGFRDRNGRFSVKHANSEMGRHLVSICQQDENAYLRRWIEKRSLLRNALTLAVGEFENIHVAATKKSTDRHQTKRMPIFDETGGSNKKATALKDLDQYLFEVQFDKNSDERFLSPGQTLFAFLVCAVISVVRQNGLILIDEPELYLHPNLEIAFVCLLKSEAAPVSRTHT